MDVWLQKLSPEAFTRCLEFLPQLIRAFVTACLGFVLLKLALKTLARILHPYCNPSTTALIKKSVGYLGVFLLVATVLMQLGINLSALLGAAGIVSIAVGFAAQTSLSNVVSGALLLAEKTFAVGDKVQIGSLQGTVESVDFLSTKLKTPENHYIRVPNEQIVKSPVVNLSRYPKVCLKLRVWVQNCHPADSVRLNIQQALAQHCTLNGPTLLKESINDTFIFEQNIWAHNAEADRLKTAILEHLKHIFREHLRRGYFL